MKKVTRFGGVCFYIKTSSIFKASARNLQELRGYSDSLGAPYTIASQIPAEIRIYLLRITNFSYSTVT